jgi:hypothetical protein
MDTNELTKYVDQQRWLMNNGLVTDAVKNQLFFCGSIVHRSVQAVELQIEAESKSVVYKIYVNTDLLKKISKYKELSTSTTIFGRWQFKRLLAKEGSLDFQKVLNKFVTDFCGPKWSAQVEVIDFTQYVDTLGDESGYPENSQQFNKLPD